ncbi:hypothetical protein Y032_0009g635 [Ancylostoma ceylanicum]|nr:hypothetical protein Y032_0009g635 [Ancylostoma ceylanicum]
MKAQTSAALQLPERGEHESTRPCEGDFRQAKREFRHVDVSSLHLLVISLNWQLQKLTLLTTSHVSNPGGACPAPMPRRSYSW